MTEFQVPTTWKDLIWEIRRSNNDPNRWLGITVTRFLISRGVLVAKEPPAYVCYLPVNGKDHNIRFVPEYPSGNRQFDCFVDEITADSIVKDATLTHMHATNLGLYFTIHTHNAQLLFRLDRQIHLSYSSSFSDWVANFDWFSTWVCVFEQEQQRPKVHLLEQDMNGFRLSGAPIREVSLTPEDKSLLYGESFNDFHNQVSTRLVGSDDAGIVMLHGPPGGGKTTYIRHLIHTIKDKKRVVLIPKTVFESLGQPAFTNFLLSLKDTPSILVIEDAEEIVAVGTRASGPATSLLLNITDGILNDILRMQVILTFNCPLSKVDPAILRAGRLIGRFEFGPLSAAQARKLAVAKGKDTLQITGPTMLADILCPSPVTPTVTNNSAKMGF